jgi:hypothetical protein
MEIKAAPVPSELRFALQTQPTTVPTYENGVPWVYVAIICGGSILITIAIFHIQERRKRRGNSFLNFRSQISK